MMPFSAAAANAAASPLKLPRALKPPQTLSSLVSTPRSATAAAAALVGESSQRSIIALSDLCADDDEAMCRVPAPEEAEDPCMPAGQVRLLDLDLDLDTTGSSGIYRSSKPLLAHRAGETATSDSTRGFTHC